VEWIEVNENEWNEIEWEGAAATRSPSDQTQPPYGCEVKWSELKRSGAQWGEV
jgi:hypothetical protein